MTKYILQTGEDFNPETQRWEGTYAVALSASTVTKSFTHAKVYTRRPSGFVDYGNDNRWIALDERADIKTGLILI